MSEINSFSQLRNIAFKSMQRVNQPATTKADVFTEVFDTRRANVAEMNAKNSFSSSDGNRGISRETSTYDKPKSAIVPRNTDDNNRRTDSSENQKDSNSRVTSENTTSKKQETKNDVNGKAAASTNAKAGNDKSTNESESSAASTSTTTSDDSSEAAVNDSEKLTGLERAAQRLSENREKTLPDEANAKGLVVSEEKHQEAWFFAYFMSTQSHIQESTTKVLDGTDFAALFSDEEALDSDSNALSRASLADIMAMLKKELLNADQKPLKPEDENGADVLANSDSSSAINKGELQSLLGFLQKWLAKHGVQDPKAATDLASASVEGVVDVPKEKDLSAQLLSLLSGKDFDKILKREDTLATTAQDHSFTEKIDELIKFIDQLPDISNKLAALIEQKQNAPLSAQRNDHALDKIDNMVARLTNDSNSDRLSSNTSTNTTTRANGPQNAAQHFLLAQSMNDKAEWGSAFAKRIQFFLNNSIHHAELRLDPPELGRINVRIQMNSDQANVVFSAHNAQVRDAIETAVPRLRELFNDSGIQLSQVDVSTQSGFQQAQRDFDREANGRSSGRYQFEGEEDIPIQNSAGYATDRLVDYYA